ncbi:hypothetical protein GGX14DRAFT_583369 [Mycena pura]|uniref:Uncharacterized protein n=1 Tax=Mycena pura TaxID=153505 RepID=A0AAD7E5T6_9AGAR|nr:hypothetical protein GGX14DRAFT_583369 [Mycena pura]
MSLVTRRLSARRGSTTAPDPYARNAHLNRESSSILTIVRVTSPPAPSTPTASVESPPSPRARHRRLGSNPSVPHQNPGAQDPPPGRLSFAFSSFAAPQQQPSSGGGSPRLRPSSPHRASASSFSNTRLTPEQLLEVAKQATNPRYVPQSPSPSPFGAHSPVIHPRSGSLPSSQPPSITPTTFTPLPSDIYLPFLDRPAEVSALLSTPPSAKLFALLAQTFPKNVTPRKDDQLPVSTVEWTFEDLSYWLTKTTREEASDAFWVQTARTCILLHSELIWERLKGALGVPPELDVEVKETEFHDVFFSDDESDEIPEDAGKRAFGHWEDWDAVLDSPVFDRPLGSAGSSPNASRRVSLVSPLLSRKYSGSTPTITTQVPTPSDTEYFTHSPIDVAPNSSGVFIEPVVAMPDSFASSAYPPPLSLPASHSTEASGLGDIGEEDEEEDGASPAKGAEPEQPQIHGLRISTPAAQMEPNSLAVTLRSATTGAVLRSPSFSVRSPHSPALVRSNSAGSIAGLHRTNSFGSVHSQESSDSPYDPVADRSPGNPIFPSNFARLALGPTLAANNPSLRSPTLPPQFKHGVGVRRSSSSADHGNRFRRSWTGIGDDYAVTVASESSAGGSVRDGGEL